MTTRERGSLAEQDALDYLSARGLTLVKRNFLCRMGEIDLIMKHRDVLVFIEVRYRKNSRYGTPAETVGLTKQKRLMRAANLYLQQHGQEADCRFDIVAIVAEPEMRIEWIQNAFEAPSW